MQAFINLAAITQTALATDTASSTYGADGAVPDYINKRAEAVEEQFKKYPAELLHTYLASIAARELTSMRAMEWVCRIACY